MSAHLDAKSLRNLSFKISKTGASPATYRDLRLRIMELPQPFTAMIPSFITECESPEAVRAHLSRLIPNDEQGGIYKRRRRLLEQQFSCIIYHLEREEISSEIDAFFALDHDDRSTMDHVVRIMRESVGVDPGRSILVSRHAVLEAASCLLEHNGVRLDTGTTVSTLLYQIVQIADHPAAGQQIHFRPLQPFMAAIAPLVGYIDKTNEHYSWEEGNRWPDSPSLQVARHFCHAATLLCETIWQWTIDDAESTP